MVGLMLQAFPGIWVFGAASGSQPLHPTPPSDGQVQLSLAFLWLCPSLEQNRRPPPHTSLQNSHSSTLIWASPGPSKTACHLLHPLPPSASCSGLNKDSPTACPLLLPPALLPHFHNAELRAHSASGPRHSLCLPCERPGTSRPPALHPHVSWV